MDSKAELERTYSREQQRMGEAPIALVRTTSQKSSRSRRKFLVFVAVVNVANCLRVNIAENNAPCATYFKGMEDKELETELSEPELGKEVEEIATRSPSTASCARGEHAVPERKVIRFDGGDGENPDNCMYCLCVIISGMLQ
jgi:hypothetical protein